MRGLEDVPTVMNSFEMKTVKVEVIILSLFDPFNLRNQQRIYMWSLKLSRCTGP